MFYKKKGNESIESKNYELFWIKRNKKSIDGEKI